MENQNQFVSSQTSSLPGFGKLLKNTCQIFKQRFWTFVGILALPFFVSLGLIYILPSVYFLPATALFIKILLVIISVIFLIIISAWSYVALLFAIKQRETGIGIRECFKKGWRKIISFIWISFLEVIIVFGGFLLLIIPGIIFSIWFSLAKYILVSEDQRGMKALLKSKQLIKGNWWPVAWRFLLMGLIMTIISSILLYGGNYILTFWEISTGKKLGLGDISSFVLSPFMVIFGYLIYEGLKIQKQGFLAEGDPPPNLSI